MRELRHDLWDQWLELLVGIELAKQWLAGRQVKELVHCHICEAEVASIGPWCMLYLEREFCPPLKELRRQIREADAIGDGPLVNALCGEIRRCCGDSFVP